MFTDIVGFTSLAQTDEALALQLLARHHELLRPLFPNFHGREVKTIGDSFLVEFESALDATNCAVEIQRILYEYNLSAPSNGRIGVRIGIHVGDVVHSAEDVLGDSVNIASRIEPLAEPGGICLSEQVFDQVRNKIPNPLEKLETKELKNVRFAIDVYRLVLPWNSQVVPSAGAPRTRIAVLPFANISPDPRDDYVSDGLTEELITVLSQLQGLRVIARTSVNQYKGTPKGIAQIGQELGVGSILEGSVRKVGDRLRITAQLIDVGRQEHAWAKSFDRVMDDVFAVQTEIARLVAESLRVTILAPEEARLESRPPIRPDSYLAYLKGRTLLRERTENALRQAKEQFETAISLDERNAAAYSGLSDVTQLLVLYYDFPASLGRKTSRSLASRAVDLDPGLAEVHVSLAFVLDSDYQYSAAEREYKLAIALNPSYSTAHHWYAILLVCQGRSNEALRHLALAEEADPFSSIVIAAQAQLLFWLGRTEESSAKLEKLGELEQHRDLYHTLRMTVRLDRSDFDGAIEDADWLRDNDPNDPLKPWNYAVCFALAGKKEQAREYLEKLKELP
jgi:TolB-like protein/Flp pilus assembly protein TadD